MPLEESSTPVTAAAARWPVRKLLMWLVCACLLPGVVGAAALFIYEFRQARAQLERTTLQTARALVQAVDGSLLRVQALAQSLALSEALVRGNLEAFHGRAQALVAGVGLGVNVVLRDESGRQILNSAVDFDSPLPRERFPEQVRDVFATGRPTVSDVFVGPVLKRPLISVDVPVMRDGKVVYALGVGILPEHFNALLQAQNLPPDWVAGVFDSTGTIVGRSRAAEQFVGQKASPKLLDSMRRFVEGTTETTTTDGTPVLSFHTRSPLTNWQVAIGIPREGLEAALGRTLALIALGVVALFTISLLLARAMGRRIAASVEALTAPAAALGRGASLPVPRVYIREAAEVAAAIDRAGGLLKEREATLQARDEELAEAHRLARFGTWHWNLQTDEVKVSDAIREMFGREPSSFAAQRGTLLTVDSWERMLAAGREAVRTGQGYDLELEANHAAGYSMWVQVRGEVVRAADGRVVALRGAIQDITERKLADDRLRESGERFRLLADNIAQLAWMADGDGRIFWYNQRWFDYTGMARDDMQGWGWQKVHHPDHVERVAAKIRRSFEAGEPWEDTFPLKGADGNYRWFLSRAIPERDAAGRVVRWFGTNTDITAQRETEQELRKFKLFSDYAGDVHLLLDASGRIRYANRQACQRFGYAEAELLGMNIGDIDPLYPAERFEELFARAKQASQPPFETVHRHKDGSTLPVEVTASVLEFGGEWLMLATSRDLTERKLAEQRVIEAALHDKLTGLPNRALVFEYGGHLLAGARRNHAQGALLFIDLDRFKPINDLYGHETGDRVLQEVAKRLADCTRHEDLVGRLGGDEFVILLPHLDADRHRAAAVAQHVIDSITRPFHVGELELSLSPSVGISYFPEHASDVGALLHAADLAMYQAKQSGRANYQFYTPELERIAGEVFTLEARLKNALKHDGLKLHYQPVVDIKSGELIGAEALVRLADNGDETVGPDRFIPIAEAAGLIGELGDWVAAEACRQHDEWLKEGLAVTIAINVSPLQFRQRAFAQRLGRIVAASGTDPHCLQVEVTESTVMESVDEAIRILNELKSFGMKVSLDDFGTGHSSLSSLSSLPLDKLKVDQSFVRRIELNPRSQAITKAVIALGRALNLEIVGEGIESAETLQYLRSEGCDQAQGFWLSRPLPAAEFAQWCRGHPLH